MTNHDPVLARLMASKPSGAEKKAASAFEGSWTNQFGSVAEFVVKGTTLNGTYVSNASGGAIKGTIVGSVTSDIAAFTVLWETAADGRASLTSWVGQIIELNGKEVLKTLWHLVVDVSDAQEPSSYTSVFAGADEFLRK